MAYLFVSFPLTLKVIRKMQDLSNAIRLTFVQHFARFQQTRRVTRSSAIAELLVLIDRETVQSYLIALVLWQGIPMIQL